MAPKSSSSTSIRQLLYLALATIALAVPSSTYHDDRSVREPSHHKLLPHPTTQWTYPSAWRRAGLRLFITVWEYFHPLETLQASISEGLTLAPPPHLLAQYGDQIVLRFNVTTEEEVNSLAEASETLFLDVWNARSDVVDLRLSKDVIPSLLGLLPKSLQHAHRALLQGHELARAVVDTYPSPTSNSQRRTLLSKSSAQLGSNIFFEDYQSLHVMEHWLELLESLYPAHVQIVNVGTSYEGRNIKALKVGVQPTGESETKRKRKTIIVTGGAHAREWISVTTINYVAFSLITQYGKQSSTTRLLEDIDFIFVPTINPDGYQYSFEHDRLWRKNRQPTSLSFCPGVDLDRSWGFQWDGERTSDNPCSESFAGDAPFASYEAGYFATWAKNETLYKNVEFIGFLDLHSYAQEIMYPYSYSCRDEPPTLEDLQEMGYGLAKQILSSSRESYKVIPACEGNVAANGKVMPKLEGGGGSALDWFYAELGVRKAFQIKLRDQGVYGFLLPREYIIPTGKEMLSAIEWFGQELARSSAAADKAVSTREADLRGGEDRPQKPFIS